MSFLQWHKVCTYLLALTGLLALLLPGILPPVSWLIALLGLGLSWLAEEPRIKGLAYRLRWTVVTFTLFLAGILAALFRFLPDPITLGAWMLILLQVNKLSNRLEKRDYLHIYLLSFLMLVLGSILNVDLSYAFLFLAYIILATWTLTIFHLRRELEDTHLTRHEQEGLALEKIGIDQILQSRSLIRGSFLVSSSLLALVIFLLSTTFFVAFPRIGFGLFFQRQRQGNPVAGFSNQVDLGSFGTIQQNRQVVLRIEPSDSQKKNPPLRLPGHWRGMAFDFYDGTAWKRSLTTERQVYFSFPELHRLRSLSWVQRRDLRWLTVYQEPIEASILFGFDPTYEIRVPIGFGEQMRGYFPQLHIDLESETIRYRQMPGQGGTMRYMVGFLPSESRPLLRPPTSPPPTMKPDRLARFLQMPPAMRPRIQALTETITAKIKDPSAKIQAILLYLQTNYRYSLSRGPSQGNPIEDFLFRQKSGHCEFFSTAMIMMLRSIGVPSRQVTGFLGAEWNPYGGYYAIRQNQAHSWLEAYAKDTGWTRYDPTPASNLSTPISQISAWFEDRLDALRMLWYKWVVDYSFKDQAAIMQSLRELFQSFSSKSVSRPDAPERDWSSFFQGAGRKVSPLLGGTLLLLLLLLLFRLWWKRTRTEEAFKRPISQLYEQALRLLADRGFPRQAHETPYEFQARLALKQPKLASILAPLTEIYLRLRFAIIHEAPSLAPLQACLDALRSFLHDKKAS